MNIYSSIEPETLLHVVKRLKDVEEQVDFRADMIDPDNFIQCSSLNMVKGHTFKPHEHIYRRGPHITIAQESWVVIRGSVRCVFYDIDKTVLEEVILYPGDVSFTLMGGHTYVILEDKTIVYEYKTGPYGGQKTDKIFI